MRARVWKVSYGKLLQLLSECKDRVEWSEWPREVACASAGPV